MTNACKGCDRLTHSLTSGGYCPACDDRLKPMDGDCYDDTRGEDDDEGGEA